MTAPRGASVSAAPTRLGLIVGIFRRRWSLVLAGLVATATLVGMVALTVPTTYEAETRVMLLPPLEEMVSGQVENPYLRLGGMSEMLEMLARRASADVAGAGSGLRFVPDRTMGAPVVMVLVEGSDPGSVAADMERAPDLLAAELRDLQGESGISDDSLIRSVELPLSSGPTASAGRQLEPMVALTLLGALGTACAAVMADHIYQRRSTRLFRRSRSLQQGVETVVALFHWDATTVLTIYLVVLYAIPSDRRFGPLGAAGSPSVIAGLALLLWWCWHQVRRSRPGEGSNPVRGALFVFLAACLVAYVAAMLRAIPVQEVSTADTGLLRLAGWAGVLLVAHDGIPDRDRAVVLMRRLGVGGGLFALVGLVQFVTGQSWVDQIQIPGLISSQDFSNVQDRAGFIRSAGTAMHALEYAMVLSMILPVAVTMAIWHRGARFPTTWWPAGAIVLALTLAVSRSAIVGAAVALLVVMAGWPARWRLLALGAGSGLAAAVYVLVPGMVGTIRGLFTGVLNDPSAMSRATSYDLAEEMFLRSPLIGRGFGTFLPQYRIFDNQYLHLLIETGIVGLAAFVGLVVTAVLVSLRVWRGAGGEAAQTALALAASLASGATLFALFDALAFPKAAGSLFLVLGLTGAWRRVFLTRSDVDASRNLSRPLVDAA